MSHELKTPLAALREGVALLQDGVTGELTSGQIVKVDATGEEKDATFTFEGTEQVSDFDVPMVVGND